MARAVVRESVTVAGRAERARVARAFTVGVLGPGHPCGDDAALLVSELFGNSVRHSGSGAKGETVTVEVRAVGGVVRVEVTDRGGRGVQQLRACGGEAKGGRAEASDGAGHQPGLAAARETDGDLVRAPARLNLPRPATGPCAGGKAGHAGVHGRSMPGICQVRARHIGGDPERAAGRRPLRVVIEGVSWAPGSNVLRLDYLHKK
jgi:hypothetical protein